MALLNRELTFIIMLGTSTTVAVFLRLLGQLRFKKELMSIVGLIQMFWFCGYDTIHLLVMIFVGIALIQSKIFGPRIVFVYCFFHRLFFSSSQFLGLPRDEDNLANAAMFILTVKMVIVAYEVSDYRLIKMNNSQHKTKWINLDQEPSAYDIFCFMTCFVAIFTGPVYRYKTYHDMLYSYCDIPVTNEVLLKFVSCAFLYVAVSFSPITIKVYKGSFYEYSFAIRYCVSIIVALTQAMKYAIAWQLAESICLLVGLGAYPVSSNPIPGMGPSIPIQNGSNKEYNFETISTIKTFKVIKIPTIKGTLQYWNSCTQWWLAHFIYSSRVFPRNWRIARALNVMIVSAIWHGIKLGYFMTFPMLVVFLSIDDIWKKEVEDKIVWKKILPLFQTFYWFFMKMGGISFLFAIFVLQDYDEIMRFCRSMYFCGYLQPVILLMIVMVFKLITPKQNSVKLN